MVVRNGIVPEAPVSGNESPCRAPGNQQYEQVGIDEVTLRGH